jgi:hypothetical protein
LHLKIKPDVISGGSFYLKLNHIKLRLKSEPVAKTVLPPKLRTNKMHTLAARRIDQRKPVNNRNAFAVVQDRATLESDLSGSMGFAKQIRIVK